MFCEISERLNAPGKMPTVGSNLCNVADFKATTEKEPGIIAFSGSGRDFDEFKLEKVGTGTGEQFLVMAFTLLMLNT